jgi:hypothetical protein
MSAREAHPKRAEAAREAPSSAPQARGARWTERGMSEGSTHPKRAEAAREAQSAVYEYATLRVMPSIERGEAMNVGVILYCQRRDFLGCRTRVDPDRLHALAADLDLEGVRHALHAVDATCGGAVATPAGTAAASSLGERFRWLTAPRSTIVQPGPVHPGLTNDPAAELGRLFDLLVG